MDEELQIISAPQDTKKSAAFKVGSIYIDTAHLPFFFGSMVVGICLYFVNAQSNPILALILGFIPLVLTTTVLLVLFTNKPPHYASDKLSNLFGARPTIKVNNNPKPSPIKRASSNDE